MIVHTKEYINAMFSGLTFESQRHLYFWEGERVHKSITGLVEDHADEFDEAKWLPICAKKEGMTEHELKHKWQTINKQGCELGSETHDFMEMYTGLETPSSPQQVAGIAYLKEALEEYDIVYRELRMYSRKYKFAGTTDLLLKHKITGEYVLADYKTNKDLFKAYGMLKPPFQYLENHPYNKYQLQLSYYQMMLDEINIHVSKRVLVYLRADATYLVYPTWDFVESLHDYLNNKMQNAA